MLFSNNSLLIHSKDYINKDYNLSYWRFYNKEKESVPFSDFSYYIIKSLSFYKKRKTCYIIAHFLDYMYKKHSHNQKINHDYVYTFMKGYFKYIISLEKNFIIKNYSNKKNIESRALKKASKRMNIIDGFLCFCELIVKKNNTRQIKGIGRGSFFKTFDLDYIIKTRFLFPSVMEEYNHLHDLSIYFNIEDFCAIEYIENKFGLETISSRPNSFPILLLPNFLENCYYYRDLAIYAFIAGTGLKPSETLIIKEENIDFENKEIYISDMPNQKSFLKDNDYTKNPQNGFQTIQDIMDYDLVNLKEPIKKILNYDLNNLGHSLSNILSYDIENIWRSTKKKEEKVALTQEVIDRAYEERDLDSEEDAVFLSDNITEYNDNDNDNDNDFDSKGYELELIYFIPHLKSLFFFALEQYYKKEYKKNCGHDYVFQFITGKKKGEPYYQISRQGFKKTFERNIQRTPMTSSLIESEITPYNLKYFYIFYMLNYIDSESKTISNITEDKKSYQLKKYKVKTNVDIEAQKEVISIEKAKTINNVEDLLDLEIKKYKELQKKLL